MRGGGLEEEYTHSDNSDAVIQIVKNVMLYQQIIIVNITRLLL